METTDSDLGFLLSLVNDEEDALESAAASRKQYPSSPASGISNPWDDIPQRPLAEPQKPSKVSQMPPPAAGSMNFEQFK